MLWEYCFDARKGQDNILYAVHFCSKIFLCHDVYLLQPRFTCWLVRLLSPCAMNANRKYHL